MLLCDVSFSPRNTSYFQIWKACYITQNDKEERVWMILAVWTCEGEKGKYVLAFKV